MIFNDIKFACPTDIPGAATIDQLAPVNSITVTLLPLVASEKATYTFPLWTAIDEYIIAPVVNPGLPTVPQVVPVYFMTVPFPLLAASLNDTYGTVFSTAKEI